jgi:ArsR family transcriptional regulator
MLDTADIFKTLANPHRVRILELLFNSNKEMCVNELSEKLGISQSLTSQNLSYLAARNIIEPKRYGQTTCYIPANNEQSKLVNKILKAASN